GLDVGNGTTAGDKHTIYFTAGPDDEMHGLFGSLTIRTPRFAVGADAGSSPTVRVFDGLTGRLLSKLDAFGGKFRGGVRVAAADVNGDGLADVVAGAGSSGGPRVRVFDGQTAAPLAGALGSFNAFAAGFRGGVFVAAADVNGDGSADVVVGTGPGTA